MFLFINVGPFILGWLHFTCSNIVCSKNL